MDLQVAWLTDELWWSGQALKTAKSQGGDLISWLKAGVEAGMQEWAESTQEPQLWKRDRDRIDHKGHDRTQTQKEGGEAADPHNETPFPEKLTYLV